MRTQTTRCLHVLSLLLREIYSEVNFGHLYGRAGNTADIQLSEPCIVSPIIVELKWRCRHMVDGMEVNFQYLS